VLKWLQLVHLEINVEAMQEIFITIQNRIIICCSNSFNPPLTVVTCGIIIGNTYTLKAYGVVLLKFNVKLQHHCCKNIKSSKRKYLS